MQFYEEMFRKGWAPPMSNTQISNVWEEFANGFYSFYITGPWNIGEFKRRVPNLLGRWSTAALPVVNGQGGGAAGGSSFAIFRNSKNKQLAWELAEYLSAVAQQQKFSTLTGDLPPTRTAWNYPELAADEYAHAFREQLAVVKPTPKVPEWERITDEIAHTQERVVRGGESIDQALRELDERTDQILEKRRWMLSREHAP